MQTNNSNQSSTINASSVKSQDSNNSNLSTLIEMPEVHFPSGGGAIKGIDEQFKVNSANGTASFSIPLPLSPGRNGFTPPINLNYNSGAGNGAFGLGWQLGVGAISIKTDKSLPKYTDEDTYQFSGAEELVPYLKESTSGIWEKVQSSSDNYTIQRYRPRTEGAFLKIEKITHVNQKTYWKVTSRDNKVTIFGRNAQARIADPDDDSRIFKWLAEFSYDDKGNWIKYTYKEEDLANVSHKLDEKHRLNETVKISNRYLKRVQYGNKKAYFPDPGLPFDPKDPTQLENSEEAGHFFEIVFDYGEHNEIQPKKTEETEWLQRTDAFSSYRSGFEIRTNRLCKRLLMFHQFLELGEDPCLVRTLTFDYSPSSINNSGQSETTYLSSVVQSGYSKLEDGSYSSKSLPPMSFNYQNLKWNHNVQQVNQEDITNTPIGLTNNYLWTDLYGEGISGILTEQGGGWFYKQNLGDLEDQGVQFTAIQKVAKTPSIKGLNSGIISLQDLDGNGEKQLVVNHKSLKGYYQLKTQDHEKVKIERFRSFKQTPNFDKQNTNIRYIDLNGDGKPELVVSEENAFLWYKNLGKDGYEHGIKVFKSIEENLGPAIVFSDSTQSIFLADLSGDGLTDIVRIRNGEICYWPNKGYGSFGAKVSMSNAPLFDHPDQFNSSFLHLSDLTGTGAIDIIYIGKNEFKAYINLSGNSWSDSHKIQPFSSIDNRGKLSVIDLLGTGTSCIVWSSVLPGDHPMKYIDLMGSKKPHVMIGYNNNMGKEVKLTYKSSSYFYLKDKKEGNPWITKLPFSVQVIATSTTTDHISSTQLSSSYRYHHGYYDHNEREFRGFGMVEQIDQELFETYQESDVLDIPPVLVKTWLHTGSYTLHGKFSQQYKQEYYSDDVHSNHFPDSIVENASSMSFEDIREANRALKGTVLRTEMYSKDGSNEENIPYSITETNFEVKPIQPRGNSKYGVFQVVGKETLSYSTERKTSDPRISHQMILEEDNYGHPTLTAQIAYPRNSLIDEARPEQQKLKVILQQTIYENEEEEYYRLGLPVEQRQFEIEGLELVTDTLLSLEGLKNQLNEIDAPLEENTLKYHESFSSGVQARLWSWNKTHYKEGELKPLALPEYQKSIVMSNEWLVSSYDGKVDNSKMMEAGYQQDEGYWWLFSERPSYQEADGFYLPFQSEDAFGNISSIEFDSNNLAVIAVTDALFNTITAEIDYRTLSAWRTTDINGTISEAITDELGMVIATSVMGTENGIPKGDQPIAQYQRVEAQSLDDVVHNPLNFLQESTSFFYYHLEAWHSGNLPPHFVQVHRETHVSELAPGETPKVQVSLGYSDGFGRELQSKVYMGDNQWVVSGRTVYNNKEKPIKQYEPFITDTYTYQSEEEVAAVGVTPILYYDPLGRLIKTETPNGFLSKIIFDPWQVTSYDQNDTVLESGNYLENLNLIGTDDPKGLTLEKAIAHKNTPTKVYLDSLGREFMVQQFKEEGGEPLITYSEFDPLGNVISQTDPRMYKANESKLPFEQVKNFEYRQDLVGNILKMTSQDAGITYNLVNVVGNSFVSWNARDYQTVINYDILHRPTQVRVTGNGMDQIIQKLVYGTDPSKNENGQILLSYDQSGITENTSFSFKGEILGSTQQLCSEYKTEPNWSNPSQVSLEADLYNGTMKYNALGRLIESVQPDGSVHLPEYHHIGWLKSVKVKLRGDSFGILSNSSATTFVENIDYDAKGQRSKIIYGNGVRTTYAYDEDTFRLIRLLTTRSDDDGTSTTLQDIEYVYDPIGNIIRIIDKSHDRIFTAGQIVDADQNYVYDALYQLKEATGREHLALNKIDYQLKWDQFKNTHFANINDANQLRNYTRKFTYDESGNLIQIKHIGENSFTRNMTVSDTSNRAISDEMDTSSGVDSHFDTAGSLMKLEHLMAITWNYRNNIASATIVERNHENDVEYYVYDGSGKRIRKVKETFNSVGELLWTEEKIYLGGVEIKRRYEGNDRTLQESRSTAHIMDNQKRIALVHFWGQGNDNSIPLNTNKIHYQLGNHLGSASMELDADGLLISYEEYFPFGDTSVTTGINSAEVKQKEYRYTGKERDNTTALYYYGARYYASWLGRWINPDPAGTVDGLNLYKYVSNNPINIIDPNGLSGCGLGDYKENLIIGDDEYQKYVVNDDFCNNSGKDIFMNLKEPQSIEPGATIYIKLSQQDLDARKEMLDHATKEIGYLEYGRQVGAKMIFPVLHPVKTFQHVGPKSLTIQSREEEYLSAQYDNLLKEAVLFYDNFEGEFPVISVRVNHGNKEKVLAAYNEYQGRKMNPSDTSTVKVYEDMFGDERQTWGDREFYLGNFSIIGSKFTYKGSEYIKLRAVDSLGLQGNEPFPLGNMTFLIGSKDIKIGDFYGKIGKDGTPSYTTVDPRPKAAFKPVSVRDPMQYCDAIDCIHMRNAIEIPEFKP